jgi:histidine ammonia-lyase
VPTSAQQEDYISNGANSAWALRKALDNLRSILAVEILAGCQAIDLGTAHLGPNTQLGSGTLKAYTYVRQHVSMMHEDRPLYPDIQRVREAIASGELFKFLFT